MFDAFILSGVPWPVFWIFCAVAVLIQGISKSGFAGGAGILSLPLMMLVMPPALVAAVLLPILILCDFNAIYHHRTNKDWRAIRSLYGPCVVGILIGAAVWWWIGREGMDAYEPWIKRFVGVMAIIFSMYLVAKDRALHWVEQYRPGVAAAWFAGLSAGFSSTIAHAAGPIVGLYMFSHNLGKSLFVGTVAWMFTLINLTKLPFYIATGLIQRDVLIVGLILAPFIPVGSWMGHWMHHRVPERAFNRVILVLTVIAAIQLLTGINVIHWAIAQFSHENSQLSLKILTQ